MIRFVCLSCQKRFHCTYEIGRPAAVDKQEGMPASTTASSATDVEAAVKQMHWGYYKQRNVKQASEIKRSMDFFQSHYAEMWSGERFNGLTANCKHWSEEFFTRICS